MLLAHATPQPIRPHRYSRAVDVWWVDGSPGNSGDAAGTSPPPPHPPARDRRGGGRMTRGVCLCPPTLPHPSLGLGQRTPPPPRAGGGGFTFVPTSPADLL